MCQAVICQSPPEQCQTSNEDPPLGSLDLRAGDFLRPSEFFWSERDSHFSTASLCTLDQNHLETTNMSTSARASVGLVEELLNKLAYKREDALVSIVETLSNSTFKLELNLLENNFATFLYRCLNLFKKGSAKELHLASQAIGLLAVITDDVDNSNEIYREVVPVISKALNSGPKTLKAFECLAIATFFGASGPEETQTAMQALWTFLLPESDPSVKLKARNHLPDVLIAAISAWVFLLSSLKRWDISFIYWRGAISYFSKLLENNDDKSVRVMAGTALAMIFEIGSLNKFIESEEKGTVEISTLDSYSLLKDDIIEKLSLKPVQVCKEYLRSLQVLDYFKNDRSPQSSLFIGRNTLALSSWAKLIQLNYLKSFLGSHGLNAHMLENPKIQAVFDIKKTKIHVPSVEIYDPDFEKVTVTYYAPKERDTTTLLKKDIKKDKAMRNSSLDKAQTKLRSQNRKMAMEMKQTYFLDD